jgi:hypothetical protein
MGAELHLQILPGSRKTPSRPMGTAVILLVIAVIAGAAVGTVVRVPGWVSPLALAAGVAAYVLGYALGYEDDTPGGGSGFQTGIAIGEVLLLVAVAAFTAVIAGALSRRR